MNQTNETVLTESGLRKSWEYTHTSNGVDELNVYIKDGGIVMSSQPEDEGRFRILSGWHEKFSADQADHLGKLLIAKAQELRASAGMAHV